ncbi:MAG TPA: tetratricopeptide repeat protein [Vicinamibacteria bacterium]|nr:tetratricopeptide repeat protein [Vicinamibacteria bacterium]
MIVAKARRRTAAPRAVVPAEAGARPAGEGPSGVSRMGIVLGASLLVLVGAVGSRLWDRAHRPPPGALQPATLPAAAGPAPLVEGPPPSLSAQTPPPTASFKVETIGVPDADRARAERLVRRLADAGSLSATDVQAAEDLVAGHPDERPLRDLLEAVLLGAAQRHQRQRQFPQAVAYLQRAHQVQPTSTRPLIALLQVAMEMGDWPAAEAAARAAIAVAPRTFDTWQGLGFALMRQDRNREAVDALRSALELRDDSNTRLLMERIQKGMADERGMAERRLSHFSVRYDGGEHEEVGREILRALERHYATLVTALDYQPVNTISVILFTREGYYNASGAPAWSGGAYDNIDGRIRIPIGGLTSSLTPDMDETLIHELTHAFVADRTRGQAPRELHEGLAQYMEGKRLDSMLTSDQIAALADGRIGGVAGYYLGSLSFVEYLIANRGLGGINELLKAMGETGSADEAFRQVHGTSFRGAQQAWTQRFRQQRGRG